MGYGWDKTSTKFNFAIITCFRNYKARFLRSLVHEIFDAFKKPDMNKLSNILYLLFKNKVDNLISPPSHEGSKES